MHSVAAVGIAKYIKNSCSRHFQNTEVFLLCGQNAAETYCVTNVVGNFYGVILKFVLFAVIGIIFMTAKCIKNTCSR